MRRTSIALVSALLLLAAGVAARADLAREFAKLWSEAGSDEAKKLEIVDRIGKERSADAAEILLGVSLAPNESGAVTDRAIQKLAEMEGSEGDQWMRRELRESRRWSERALIVRAIGRRLSDEAREPLFEALADKAWQVQAAVLEALRIHPARETIEKLLEYWSGLDLKEEDGARLAGDVRDTVLVLTEKDFQTVQDAQAWWSANEKTWKPEKRKSGLVQSSDQVTQERKPKLFDDISSRRVVLVIDTSASMRIETPAKGKEKGAKPLSRFEFMRTELKRVIEDLPHNAHFTLITFGDKVLPWKLQLVAASEANKRSANKFVDQLKPDGATNSYGAIEAAFKVPEADTIYFLSDGYPTVGKTDFNVILGDVKKWNLSRNLRVHTIAFIAGDGKPLGITEDKAIPKEFMRRLAQENGGRYKLVE